MVEDNGVTLSLIGISLYRSGNEKYQMLPDHSDENVVRIVAPTAEIS